MSMVAYWQSFFMRLSKPFIWVYALAFWPGILGWLGFWLLPGDWGLWAWMIAVVCTVAFIIGVSGFFVLWVLSKLLWGRGRAFIDENGRPYPDFVIEAIKYAEATGEEITDKKVLKALGGYPPRSM